MISRKTEKILIIVLQCAVLIGLLIGLLYRDGGTAATVPNLFGDQVQMFGNGIYAKNAVLTVANRFGADAVNILGAVFVIGLYSIKKESKYVEMLKAAVITSSLYTSFSTIVGLTMNRLYLLYVFSFGLSFFLAINILMRYFRCTTVISNEKQKTNTGLSNCLIVFGVIVLAIWLSAIIPCIIRDNYTELLGLLSAEVTFAFDIGIISPAMVICGLLVRRKKDIGFLIAPLLLYILIWVGPLVIAQDISCIIMGIDVPLPKFINMVASFVVLSVVSVICFVRFMRMLRYDQQTRKLG